MYLCLLFLHVRSSICTKAGDWKEAAPAYIGQMIEGLGESFHFDIFILAESWATSETFSHHYIRDRLHIGFQYQFHLTSSTGHKYLKLSSPFTDQFDTSHSPNTLQHLQ